MKNIQQDFVIKENTQLTDKTFLLRLEGEMEKVPVPGQFVNIQIPGKYLRRPISVHDYDHDSGELHLLYDMAGEGTRILSVMKPGERLNLLINLGNGFSLPDNVKKPVLLGGGIGCAPLLYLAKRLVINGVMPCVVLGFNKRDDIFGMEEKLREIGIATYITTVDGSKGTKGFVTDALIQNNIAYDYFYACGPLPMLKALSDLPTSGQLSLESRMGCGFGICVCCSLSTVSGAKRICKEGPVFEKSELIWK